MQEREERAPLKIKHSDAYGTSLISPTLAVNGSKAFIDKSGVLKIKCTEVRKFSFF
jgi:hypothetical protein